MGEKKKRKGKKNFCITGIAFRCAYFTKLFKIKLIDHLHATR